MAGSPERGRPGDLLALLPKSFGQGGAPWHVGIALPVFAPSTWMAALAGVSVVLLARHWRRPRWMAALMSGLGALVLCIGIGSAMRGGASTRELVGAVQYLSAPIAYAVGCLLVSHRSALAALRLTSAGVIVAQFGCASLQRLGVPLNPMGTVEAARLLGDRTNGTLNHPVNLAKAIVLVLALYYITNGPAARLGLQLPTLVGRYGIPGAALATTALTGSRTGLLAVLMLIVVGELMLRRLGGSTEVRGGRARRQTLIGMILLGVGVLAAAPVFIVRMIADPAGGSRAQIMSSALQFLADRPWWGIGPNNYVEVVGRIDPIVSAGVPVHNGVLLAAVELGIPGAVILLTPVSALAVLSVWKGVFWPTLIPAFCLAFTVAYFGIAATTYGVMAESMLPLWFLVVGVATMVLVQDHQRERRGHDAPTRDGHPDVDHRSGTPAGAEEKQDSQATVVIPAQTGSSGRGRLSGVVGGASALAASRIVGSGLQAVAMVLLARYVDPRGFGAFGGYFGAVAFLAVVADAGVSTALLRWRALGRDAAVRAGLRLNVLTTVGGLVVAAALGLGLTAGTMAPWIAVLLAAGWMLDKNVETMLSLAIADGRMGHAVVSILGRKAVQVAIFVAAVELGGEPFAALAYGLLAASVLGLVHVRFAVRIPGTAASADVWRALLDARAYLVSNVSAQARVLDATVVSLVVPGVGAGLYAAASRIFSPFVSIPSALSAVLVPHSATARGGEARRLFWRTNLVVVLVVGAVSVVGIAAAPWLAELLFGQTYSKAGVVIAVMLAGVPSFCASSPCGAVLQGVGRGALVAKIGVLSAAALLITVAGGAALFGAVGAAAAVSLTYLFKHAALLVVGAAVLRSDRVVPVAPSAARPSPSAA
ncbi:O-antigen ligase family protein [Micromonospora tarensis]|uniref:Oligosaccharide flippase family protein n=1 Tax=Micromonospora tarensis TaxID=2806100 RepID=A0ABS1YN37_9ACTN|nr:O-antigen ligase family protein [Micromonospora tarensis]MBM0278549.1 oligosaccharide flippase family protein [Micromonospora tarensis]